MRAVTAIKERAANRNLSSRCEIGSAIAPPIAAVDELWVRAPDFRLLFALRNSKN